MRSCVLLVLFLSACGGGIEAPPKQQDQEASGAQLVLGAELVDFGEVTYGTLHQQNVSISNPGETDLVIESLSLPEPFRVSPSSLQLRAGISSLVTIYVQPLDYEDRDVELVLQTNDESIGTVRLPVRARVQKDADGDGHDIEAAGGDDCDDADPLVYGGAQEVWYDGVDEDCDGASDYDQDADGFESVVFNASAATGGGDCQDTSVQFYPGAADAPYDNLDTDCAGDNDWDQDGDGYGAAAYGRGSDCDDTDEDVNREALERLDFQDNDCDGSADNDVLAENATHLWAASGAYDRTGYATALGDLDNDGIAELIIGSPWAGTSSGSGNGAVAIWRGGRTLPTTSTPVSRADNLLQGASPGDYVGSFLAVVGDTDGDGYAELAVGASQRSSNTGAVYLLKGRDALYRDLSDARVTYTGSSSSQLGKGIASNVDLDGDGYQDIVMTMVSGGNNGIALDYGNTSTGSVALSSTDAQFSTDGNELAFHRNAPVGGDFDGDGLDDLVLSDGSADYGSSNTGAVWVLWGRSSRYAGADGLENQATTVAYGSASEEVGWATQLGGDWDGDGDEELWLYTSGAGLVLVPGGTDRRARFTPASAAMVSYAWDSGLVDAEMIRQLGDWDGDGIPEIIVFLEDSGTGTGANLLFGSAVRSGSWDAEAHSAGSLGGSSTHRNGNVGFGIAPVPADVDDDGDLDQLMGDPEFDGNAGEVYLLRNRLVR